MTLFVLTVLNGLTLAGLYFLVASGFSLVFGLMRNINLAHGSLYLLGGYIGYSTFRTTGSWELGVAVGALSMAVAGAVLQYCIFRFMEGQALRQTLVTIAISIIAADLMLWYWGATAYQFTTPDWVRGATPIPFLQLAYPTYRLFVLLSAVVVGIALWLFLNKTRIGIMIRAGVDDKDMLDASGVNVQVLFCVTFAVGAALAGLAGVLGGSYLSLAPGEDMRFLLASLIVVIVGGMGSIVGAAVGAVLIGLTEQFGLAYAPSYAPVYTFLILVFVLAFRPQGIMGRPVET